jgi:hypothetical protein
MKIQLDTSGISKVMKTDEALSLFVSMAKKKRWKVSISRLVLDELLCGPAERQMAACVQLLKLADQLKGVFLIACSAKQLWPLELDQCISAVLSVPDYAGTMAQIQHVARTGEIEKTGMPQIADAVTEWKLVRDEKSVLARDQGRTFFRQQGMTARGLGIELEKYGPRSIPDYIFERTLRDFADRPGFLMKRLYRDRDRSSRSVWSCFLIRFPLIYETNII